MSNANLSVMISKMKATLLVQVSFFVFVIESRTIFDLVRSVSNRLFFLTSVHVIMWFINRISKNVKFTKSTFVLFDDM